MSGVIVEVAARKFAVPFECPCCGAVPDTEMVVGQSRAPGKKRPAGAHGLVFPYCTMCVDHAKRFESAGLTSAVVMLLAIVAAVVVTIAVQLVFGLLIFLAAVPIAVVLASTLRSSAQAGCGEACASSGKSVAYYGWSGEVRSFKFESPTYTARFAEQNTKVLSNPSAELRKLLEGYKFARLAVPTPAAPAMVIPPPLTAREWITRIEGHKGRVERRNALQRALEIVVEPQDRKDLITASSRLELAPVLDKLAAIASPVARRRHLQAAIEQIRADNIPDDLQDAELRDLEARLSAL
ncbi:MAG: hypothetical protein JWO36_1247 [Myxococcales bacterium]|nr:hypothetical protein [Myxococcales bacterium]